MATDVYFARGGLSWSDAHSGWTATWPFGTLRASREALVLRIGPFWPFRRTFAFRREDVHALRVYGGWWAGGFQVEHGRPDRPPNLGFATIRYRALCAALAELGYPLAPGKWSRRDLIPLLVLGALLTGALCFVVFTPSSTPAAWRLGMFALVLLGVAAEFVVFLGLAAGLEVVEQAVRRRWGTAPKVPSAPGAPTPQAERFRERAAGILGLLAFLAFLAWMMLTPSAEDPRPLGERLAGWGWWLLSWVAFFAGVIVLAWCVELVRRAVARFRRRRAHRRTGS